VNVPMNFSVIRGGGGGVGGPVGTGAGGDTRVGGGAGGGGGVGFGLKRNKFRSASTGFGRGSPSAGKCTAGASCCGDVVRASVATAALFPLDAGDAVADGRGQIK
jgi:hypothetical protein